MIYSAIPFAIGLLFGLLSLPWRHTQWRNVSTLEYWILWTVFWWALLPYMAILAVIRYSSMWSDYKARRRYERSRQT